MNPNHNRFAVVCDSPPSYEIATCSQNPPYEMLNDDCQGNAFEIGQKEPHRFWAVRPLLLLSTLHMIFGMFLCLAQLATNRRCDGKLPEYTIETYNYNGVNMVASIPYKKTTTECSFLAMSYGLWCGSVLLITGLLTIFATRYKTNSLVVISSIFGVISHGVSIFCLVISISNASPISELFGGTFAAMAVISGLNFFVTTLTSAFLCRASCSCCQPQIPVVISLTSVGVSSSEQQNFVPNLHNKA